MEIVELPSISGDDCHVDIRNVSARASGNYAKTYFCPPNIYMCCDGNEIQLTTAQYEDLLNNLCDKIAPTL